MDNGNIFESPLHLAFSITPDENGKFNVDPEERMYTLFIFFIDGYDQEKTFKFAMGQTAVREYIIEHVDIIDFEKSKISSWQTRPYDYLESQVEIDEISETERENYDNAIHMIMNGSVLQDISRLEEEGDEYDV